MTEWGGVKIRLWARNFCRRSVLVMGAVKSNTAPVGRASCLTQNPSSLTQRGQFLGNADLRFVSAYAIIHYVLNSYLDTQVSQNIVVGAVKEINSRCNSGQVNPLCLIG